MIIALCGLLLAAGGCATLGWYSQAARGQMELLLKRKDIEKLIASPETAEEKRQKLELVLELRDFADDRLGLANNGSYAGFVKLERDAVVYNVIAAPEFSVAPKTWCYPLVGCLAYRGYFKRDAAERRARSLRKQGFDTLVSPVAAYSTLGRFNDPVTSPMLEFSNLRLAGLLFHELAHQRVFVKGETDFNEAYATAVERAGVRRWLELNAGGGALQAWARSQRLEAEFTALLLETRSRLQALYATDLPPARMRDARQAVFDDLRLRYAEFSRVIGDDRFDAWMEQDLNNAHLALLATYEAGADAFGDLLAEYDGDFERFHQAVERLAAAGRNVRADFLNRCRTSTVTDKFRNNQRVAERSDARRAGAGMADPISSQRNAADGRSAARPKEAPRMHQDGVAALAKGWAIAGALRLGPAPPGDSGCIERYGSRYEHCP